MDMNCKTDKWTAIYLLDKFAGNPVVFSVLQGSVNNHQKMLA